MAEQQVTRIRTRSQTKVLEEEIPTIQVEEMEVVENPTEQPKPKTTKPKPETTKEQEQMPSKQEEEEVPGWKKITAATKDEPAETSESQMAQSMKMLMESLILLRQDMKEDRAKVSDQIVTISSAVSDEIKAVSADIKASEDKIKASMSDDIKSVSDEIKSVSDEIKETKREIKEDFQLLKEDLEARLQKNSEEINKRFEQIHEQQEEFKAEIRTQVVEQVEEKIATVAEDLTKKCEDNHTRLADEMNQNQQVIKRNLDQVTHVLQKHDEAIDDNQSKIAHVEKHVKIKVEEVQQQITHIQTEVLEDIQPRMRLAEERITGLQLNAQQQDLMYGVKEGVQGANCKRQMRKEVFCEKFSGHKQDSPMMFLKTLKHHMQQMQDCYGNHFTWEYQKNVIQQAMTSKAKSWYEISNTMWTDLESFEKQFIAHYWDLSTQSQERDWLMGQKYYEKGNLTREEYAIERYRRFIQLESPASETSIVRELAKQMGPTICYKVESEGNMAFEKFLKILKQFDMAEETVRCNFGRTSQEGTNSNETGNYRGHKNNNRPNYRGNTTPHRGNFRSNTNREDNGYNRENNNSPQSSSRGRGSPRGRVQGHRYTSYQGNPNNDGTNEQQDRTTTNQNMYDTGAGPSSAPDFQ